MTQELLAGLRLTGSREVGGRGRSGGATDWMDSLPGAHACWARIPSPRFSALAAPAAWTVKPSEPRRWS